MKDKFIEAFKEALEMEDIEIKEEDNFRDYDEWDSIGRLSLIAMLDETFEVQIEDEEFKKIQTIGQLMTTVREKQGS